MRARVRNYHTVKKRVHKLYTLFAIFLIACYLCSVIRGNILGNQKVNFFGHDVDINSLGIVVVDTSVKAQRCV